VLEWWIDIEKKNKKQHNESIRLNLKKYVASAFHPTH
jgi:hypothetical protein